MYAWEIFVLCYFLTIKKVPIGTMCYVAGWGRTSESGASSQVLREVNVPILSQSVCNSEENYNGWLDGFEDSMLCAGYLEGKLDACQD